MELDVCGDTAALPAEPSRLWARPGFGVLKARAARRSTHRGPTRGVLRSCGGRVLYGRVSDSILMPGLHSEDRARRLERSAVWIPCCTLLWSAHRKNAVFRTHFQNGLNRPYHFCNVLCQLHVLNLNKQCFNFDTAARARVWTLAVLAVWLTRARRPTDRRHPRTAGAHEIISEGGESPLDSRTRAAGSHRRALGA